MNITKEQVHNEYQEKSIQPYLFPETYKRQRLQNQIFHVGVFIPLIYSILFYFLKIKGLYLIELLLFSSSMTGCILNQKGKKKISKIILLLILPFELTYFPIFVEDIGADFFLFIFLVIGFYVLDSKIYLSLFVSYIITLILISHYFISLGQYPEEYKILIKIFYYPDLLISTVLIASSTYIFKIDSTVYQKTIIKQSKELEQKVVELQKRETILTKLLSELNHRVKNNLQFISSLFTMQIYSSNNKIIKNNLEAARNRIDTVALLYQHLYKRENPLNLNLNKYVCEIVRYAVQITDYEEYVELDMHIDEIYLNNDITSHIGLILNELITNTLKYGISENKETIKITVNIKKEKNILNIMVRDSGPGFSSILQEEKNDSFGMKLIRTIIGRYNGHIELFNNNGAQVNISLKLNA